MKRKILGILLVGVIQMSSMITPLYSIDYKIGSRRTEPVIKQIGDQNLSIDLKTGNLSVEGTKIGSSQQVIIGEDTVYVPLKTIVKDIYKGEISYTKATNRIEVRIEGLTLSWRVGERHVIKNGKVIQVAAPVKVQGGVIYCPIHSLCEIFNMQIASVENSKRINLIAPNRYKVEIITCFPSFQFKMPSYKQNEPIEIIDSSYDITGEKIIAYEWKINTGTGNTSEDLNHLTKDIAPGEYKVYLRVKNESGVWSEWENKKLLITPNEKPIINKIQSDKTAYAQGQEIKLDYEYHNEPWEEIVAEQWSYKRVGESELNRVYVKPDHIFYEGEYEISLQLQDTYGNWSDQYDHYIHITDEIHDTELNYKFTENQPGLIIDNFEGRNYRDLEEVKLTRVGEEAGTYLLSDSPENVLENGILYEDTIIGKGRINFHHINSYTGDAKNKKIIVMAENTTSKPVTIYLIDKIIKGPSLDTLYVGQLLLYQYFKGNGHTTTVLQPGEKILLINTEDKNWGKDMLLAGQMDLFTSDEIKFTVAAMDKGMTTTDVKELKPLATSIHPRGTFYTTDLYYEVEAKGGKGTYFTVGGAEEEWCVGWDALLDKEVVNRGNYGVVYHIKIKAEEDMGILLNPRGGAFRGAVKIDGKYTYMMPHTSYLCGDSSKAAVLTTVKKGKTVEIEYALPNGSSAPVLFGMIPKASWKTKG